MPPATTCFPLINDILDMSRIESGKIQLDETEVNLSDVLHDIKTIVSGQFYAKQLELYMDAMILPMRTSIATRPG